MRLLVDTSVDSRFLVEDSAEALWATRWLRRAGLVPVSSITVFERASGFQRAMTGRESPAYWEQRYADYEEAIAGQEFYEILPWGPDAALLAAQLFEKSPFPPPGWGKRSGTRRKVDTRRSWLLDIQIAAQAAAGERSLLTRNARDFRLLSSLLERPFRLQVLSFPEDSEQVFD